MIVDELTRPISLIPPEAMWRALFEDAPEAMLAVDAETMLVVRANRTARTFFAPGTGGIEDRPVTEVFSGGALPVSTLKEKMDAALHTGGRFEWGFAGERWGEITVQDIGGDAGHVRLIRIHDSSGLRHVQKTLREIGESFVAIFRKSPVAMGITTFKEGRYLDVNGAFEHFLGYSHAEVVGRTARELGLYVDYSDRARGIDDIARHGETVNREILYRNKAGISVTGLTAAVKYVFRGEDCFLVIINDITDRKKAEDALYESEEHFRQIFVEGPMGMATVGPDFRFLKVNAALCRMLGYTEEEMARRTFADITHPEHVSADVENVNKLLRGELRKYRTEKRYVAKNGDIIWGSVTVSVVRGRRGEFLYFLAAVENINERKRVEDALRESEERYRRIVETANEGIWILDADFRATFANLRMAEMLGYDVDELNGRFLLDIVAPEAVEHTKVEMASRRAGKRGNYENVMVRKDGSRCWMLVSATPVFDSRGKFAGSFAMFSDITGRKRAEKELRESEEGYRRIVETAEEGICVLDADFTITFANLRMAEMLGYSIGEMQGRPLSGIVAPEIAKNVAREIEQRRAGRRGHYEVALLRKDNSRCWLLASATPLYDAQGRFTGSFAMLSDINDRKKAEDALRESEERYRWIVETANEGIWAMDADYRTTFANPRMAEILGYPVEEIIGRPVTDFFAPEEVEKHEIQVVRRKLGRKGHYEREVLRKDGSRAWLLVSATPLFDSRGKFAGSFAMLSDITGRKKAEDALRESEDRFRTFFANSPAGLAVIDKNLRYVSVNDTLAGYNHIPKERHPGKCIRDIVPEMAGFIEPLLEQVFATGRPVSNREVSFAEGPGRENAWIASYFPMGTEQGVPSRVGAIVINNTERKMMENRLREKQQFIERIISTTPDMIFVTDIDQGHVTNLNTEISAKMLSYATDELVRKSADFINELLHPDDVPSIRRHYEIMRHAHNGEVFEYEIRIKNGRGQWRWVRVREMAFMRTPDGIVRQSIGAATDVTEQKQDRESVQKSLEKLRKTTDGIIVSISQLVEMRDPYTAGHQRRVAQLSYAIARELNIPEAQAEGIRVAGLIHDVGKIYIPAEILSKPGVLSTLEFDVIKLHPRAGYDILRHIEFIWPVAEIAYQHQERMNGSGYPRGLKGDEILFDTRIVSVADTVEAMTFRRPYRNMLGLDKALGQIERNKGALYDARAVDACLKLFRENRFEFEV